MYKLLYIDPGTGSMLFAMVIALVGSLFYLLRGLLIKIRFGISAGKREKQDQGKIPLVIYGEDKRYWMVFEPICRELNKREFDVVYMTSSEDDPVFKCGYPHVKAQFIGEGNKGFAKMNFLNAGVVLSSTPGLDVYQWKRSRDVKYYVHIPHSAGALVMYEMFGLDYYDAVLISGKYQTIVPRKLEKLRDLPEKELHMVGTPYWDELQNKLKAAPALEKKERTVLLAPSWGPNAIFSRFGSEVIRELLKTGYHIIVRPHPQMFISEKELITKIMEEFPESDKIEWNRDPNNFEVLRRSDILISDFSGIIYDYAMVFDRPVICSVTEFDTSKYDAWWIDGPLWNLEVTARLGNVLTEENIGKIKELIDETIEDEKYAEERRKVREECWEHIGNGAAKAADYLIGKCNEIK